MNDKKNENLNTAEPVKKRSLEHWQVFAILLALYDIVMCNAAYFLALWLRFDCMYSRIPKNDLLAWEHFVPIYAAVCVVVFLVLRLYNSVWRFASYAELMRVILASVITTVVHIVGISLLFSKMPVSYYLIGAVLQFGFVLIARFSYRFVVLLRNASRGESKGGRIMIIGAGNAGRMLMRDLNVSPEISGKVCCVIDDDPNKWKRNVDGAPIVGGRDTILENVKKYEIDKIYVAIPSATAIQKRDILNICKESGCELKIIPGMYQFVLGDISVRALKDVAVEDLLGRDPIKVNMDEIFTHITGKTVLVTGGGGSIGSELCRQIADHRPKQLVIFDVYENNAYAIQLELKDKHPELDLRVLIGSVRDSRKLQDLFSHYKPQLVFHAAAHKHVPLMEDSPCEAVKNNAIGTYKTAFAALLNGCERFVLISTDKAVNPVNIMGASKRLCEMIIQTFAQKVAEGKTAELPDIHMHTEDPDFPAASLKEPPKTQFVAVRFGNVLGSNGSVIPRFKEQIAAGGPVTVTHPDIIRYFMTIPEAVSLVLQAAVYAHGGEIFVLDMGTPMKIDTLARNLIKLSGLRPDIDIPIVYTGLRPGEKLYEEKLMAEEGLKTTPNKLIHIGCPIPFDHDSFLVQLKALMRAAYDERKDICELVEQIVTTYHPVN